jgi:hypothetical protein
MLFGSLPFNEGSMFALQAFFKKMKKYRVPKNAKISKESVDVLEKMLHKIP